MMGVGLAGQIVVGLIAGLLVGAFHFSSLWWNTQFFTTGAAGKAIALQLGRIAVAVAVLTLLARLLGFAARRDPAGLSLFWSTKSTRPLPS